MCQYRCFHGLPNNQRNFSWSPVAWENLNTLVVKTKRSSYYPYVREPYNENHIKTMKKKQNKITFISANIEG